MQNLTIVVTCTERKSLPVSADLQIRSLPDGSIPERYDTWRARLDRAVDRVPLDLLYAGEAWAQVKRLSMHRQPARVRSQGRCGIRRSRPVRRA